MWDEIGSELRAWNRDERVSMDFSKVMEAMDIDARRPFFTVRGKKITPKQAKQIILENVGLFHCWKHPEPLYTGFLTGILRDIFYVSGCDWLRTWLYTDGTIGGDLLSFMQYPVVDDLIPEWIKLGLRYDFLDMVVTFTDYNETPCAFCDITQEFEPEDDEEWGLCPYHEACEKKFGSLLTMDEYIEKKRELIGSWEHPDREQWNRLYAQSRFCMAMANRPDDYRDHIRAAVRIQNGRVKILTGRAAAELSEEYDRLYGGAGEEAFCFSPRYYSNKVNTICSKAYLVECFEEIGLDGEETYRLAVEKEYLSDIPEDLFVVNGISAEE